MGEESRAVAFQMLVDPDAGTGLGHGRCERGLADLKWITPQVVAVQLDQVEGIEEYARIMPPIPDAVEARHAVLVAAHGLAVDDTRARAQPGERLDDQREAVGQVVAGAAVEPHALAILARDDAEAVVLDLVHPRYRRSAVAALWWAGREGRSRAAG